MYFRTKFLVYAFISYSEDIKRTNDAVKTCDYQVPNCFLLTYFVIVTCFHCVIRSLNIFTITNECINQKFGSKIHT